MVQSLHYTSLDFTAIQEYGIIFVLFEIVQPDPQPGEIETRVFKKMFAIVTLSLFDIGFFLTGSGRIQAEAKKGSWSQ